MRHFLTLLMLTSSSLCFGQFARDTEPLEPSLVSAATAQSYYAQLYSTRVENNVYICESNTAKAHHKDQDCQGLTQGTHEVVAVTKKKAEDEYDRVPCQTCY
jgi:hypothetical protein